MQNSKEYSESPEFLQRWGNLSSRSTQQKMICYMRCVNAFFIDITNIFVNMTDFLCHFNQKDTLRIPNECLCVILTYYFLLCSLSLQLEEN